MKQYITFILIIVSATMLLAGPRVIREFSAHAEDGRGILEWTSGIETNVLSFHVQRSFDGLHFNDISNVDPAGDDHKYRYIDNDLFKGNLSSYYYRISAVLSDNKTYYSEVKKITVNSSGIHRTWGSIKAMFR